MPLLELTLSYVERLLDLAIVNRSESSVSLWGQSYSFGYYSVFFQVSPQNGRPSNIRRQVKRWTVNIPEVVPVQRGYSYSQRFNLNDGTWDLSECSGSSNTEVEITAVLEIASDDNTVSHGIVTGRYESNRLIFKSMHELVV
jgi:hypothetical protein